MGILTLRTNKKPQLKSFFVPITNRCLRSLQMSFKSFFSRSSVSPTYQKNEIRRGLICGLIISPYTFLLRFPRHQHFGRGKEGLSQAQNTETGVY